MKRILSTALALAMCLALLPSTALAVNEPQFKWFDGVELLDSSTNSKEGLIAVQTSAGAALFNLEGETLVDFGTYDMIGDISGGLLQVKKDGKWGYIDTTGNPVVPCEYDDVGDFSEGLAWVQKGEKRGFVDTTGEVVIPFEYDYARSFSEGLAGVKKDGKYGYINTTGEVVIPCVYDYAYDFSGGLARVEKDEKYGFVDTTGRLVIPCGYDYAYGFSDGLAQVEKDGKWGLINTSGEVVLPIEYDRAYDSSEGLARVQKGEHPDWKWGFIDTTGRLVIPFEYDYAYDFSGGLAGVLKDGKYGFIDTTGEVVIPIEYDDVYGFYDEYDEYGPECYDFSLAVVEKEGLVGLIDRDGKPVIPCEYYGIGYDGGLAITTNASGKCGLYNKDGEMLLPHIYDHLSFCFNTDISDNLMLLAQKDGNFGIASELLSDYLTLPEDGDYTVSFDSKGGSEVKTQYVNEGGKVTKPADPTKVKHVFDGWYDEDGNKWNFSTPITEDITLYAKWVEKDYTVSFNSNGGSDVAAQYVDDGEKLTKPTDPTKDGNTFGGWYRDTVFEKVEDTVYTLEVDTENLFNDVYKWNFDTDVVMGDFTLHAKWTASQNDNDDNQNNDQNNNTNNDNGGGGNGGYDGPVNIPGKKPEQPKPEQPKDETPSVSFSDVPSGAYYADAVAWAVEKGITNGVGGGSFAPEASCTRGQMMTFLWRMAGCPTVSGGTKFSDVGAGSYYAEAIAWAVSMGITNGTGGGLFSPDAECTRAQMATFLFRMVGGSAAGASGFGDVDAGAYYADAVAWAVANGITNGTGNGLFSPNMNCTRGQMVTFLFRCFAE